MVEEITKIKQMKILVPLFSGHAVEIRKLTSI